MLLSSLCFAHSFHLVLLLLPVMDVLYTARDVGMATMTKGEVAVLEIHPEYGYGSQGTRAHYSSLHFTWAVSRALSYSLHTHRETLSLSYSCLG